MSARGSSAAAWAILACVCVVAIAALVGAYWAIGAGSCWGQTNGMLLPHRFTMIGGCQVQTEVAGWVNIKHLRIER